MQYKYKTIILELLQQHPEIHDHLRRSRSLLDTMNQLAEQLKMSHEAWKERLKAPGSNEAQVASAALEIALKELEDRLPTASPPSEEPSLDEAMAFLRHPTPPA